MVAKVSTMLNKIIQYLGITSIPRHNSATQSPPKLLMTEACLNAIQAGIAPEVRKGHEGIVYLLGRTDGTVTLAVTAFRPEAITTHGSFLVKPRAMAACVRTGARLGLQIVAQVHTHPKKAFHSDGDVDGARIRYAGYISIVLPDYGRRLPSLSDSAIYISSNSGDWSEIPSSEVIIIRGQCHE